jgi:hypothetical protein
MGNTILGEFGLVEDEWGVLMVNSCGSYTGDAYNDVVREDEFIVEVDYEC